MDVRWLDLGGLTIVCECYFVVLCSWCLCLTWLFCFDYGCADFVVVVFALFHELFPVSFVGSR